MLGDSGNLLEMTCINVPLKHPLAMAQSVIITLIPQLTAFGWHLNFYLQARIEIEMLYIEKIIHHRCSDETSRHVISKGVFGDIGC